jgi:ribonuclease HII
VCRAASPQFLPFSSEGADSDRFSFERSLWKDGYKRIAGVDEAGRGPLAGPVIAACVILPADERYLVFDDSKKLSASRREQLFEQLTEAGVPIGIAAVWQDEIDRLNILQASLLAMKRAILQFTEEPDFLLIDGNQPVDVAIPQRPLVKGDSRSASIAAASIVAKVTRDRLMTELDLQYPQYNFKKHKGYPTHEHRVAIRKNGPCPLHRLSFKGVREFARRPSEESAKDDHRP